MRFLGTSFNISEKKETDNLQKTDAVQKSQLTWCCKPGPNRATTKEGNDQKVTRGKDPHYCEVFSVVEFRCVHLLQFLARFWDRIDGVSIGLQ